MKSLKLLFVIMVGILLVPFSVLAKDEEKATSNDTDTKVKVYLFRGEGCPHCAEAEEFFDSIQSELGDQFKLISYETWYNSDNASLMEKVASVRKEEASGVPYIIIGDQSWQGYASDYDEEIKSKIKEEYKKDVSERYDVMKYVDAVGEADSNSRSSATTTKKDYSSDVLVVTLILLVGAGIVSGIYLARKKAA